MNWYALVATMVLVIISDLSGAADSRTILVLDGSGSMWGQIGEKHKIEIAREVIREVLAETPENQQLGLVAYGHNRKGDCSDIETLAPLGTEHAQILSAIDGINPKGKTPLSDAVVFAANQLRYQEEPATVILVSDGIETCNADPCEVGRSLEAAGVDFTAHVIGFDVIEPAAQAQLSCLAENTGGRYLSASDAAELVVALQETVVESAANEEQPGPGLISLKATELEDGLEIESGLSWEITLSGSEDVVFEASETGKTEAVLAPGVYDVFVSRGETSQTGEQRQIELKPESSISVIIALALELNASVRTVPEGKATVNSDLLVYWDGPDRKGDYITLVHAGAAEGVYAKYKYTSQGQPLQLRVPAQTGEFEIRYMLGKPPKTLASVPLTATPAIAQLDAPATVTAGSTFDVSWKGPGQKNDWITIVKRDAKDTAYKSYAYPKSPVVSLKAELDAGDYEIRYVLAGKEVLARRPITVTDVTATLIAADEGAAGDEIAVKWTGPGEQGDWITVVSPDAKDNAYTSYFYPRKQSDGSGILRLPIESGEYELRYVQGGKKVLIRRPIRVSAVEASISSPEQTTVGALMSVRWAGPDTKNDYVSIVNQDSPGGRDAKSLGHFYTSRGNPGSMYAPIEPGNYEIRYIQQGSKILAKKKLTVIDAVAKLSAPDSAVIGESIIVTAEGPDSKNDFVALVKSDEADKTPGSYFYTKRGMTGTLEMPLVPGTYELRYVLNGKRVLARTVIQATPLETTLNAPDEVSVEESFSVTWSGPGGQRDLVVIARPDQKQHKFVNYHYARKGSPAELIAPKEVGVYEIRYVLHGKKVVNTRKINVSASD